MRKEPLVVLVEVALAEVALVEVACSSWAILLSKYRNVEVRNNRKNADREKVIW
jgi:hypothetical protein